MKTHIVDVDRKLRIDGPSRGAAQHVEERKGFKLVLRGAVGHVVDHDYECPTHGVFTASVRSDAVPDVMPCPQCHDDGPWRAPRVYQGFAAGEVTC